MKKSFAEWGIEHFGQNFLKDYWDYEKNTIDPYKISYGSLKKIWIKCKDKSWHKSYETNCNTFTTGSRCSYCYPKKESHYFDSLGFLYYDISKSIVEDKRNNLSWGDMYKITPNSHKKYYIKCLNCGCGSTKEKQLKSIIKQGFSCEYCSDGISLPEKFITNLLYSLNMEFNTQITFEWAKNKRYDFYIPNLDMIIETHGKQHYLSMSQSTWGKLESQQENDDLKKELAIRNGIKEYIVIDCRESTFEWLVKNTIKELSYILDTKNIDWKKIFYSSQKSKVVMSWELWNNGYDLKEIADILNVHYRTVGKYLNKGNEIGQCLYDGEQYRVKKVIKHNSQKIKILYPNGEYEEFDTIKDFLKRYEITNFCFNKYIKPYDEINLENIPINGYTKEIREKLKKIDRCTIS